jgi:uncharacterized protein (DUF58 family)
MATSPLIDRQLLERLERLAIRWRKSFRGLVGGHNPSRYSGPGQEFLDHRNFHQGDDLRAVNWRAYMRLEKLFLKMFQVEPRTPIRLLLDASASMTAGSEFEGATKFDYARKLAAALVYVGLVRHDTIALQPFHERLEDPLTASGGRHRFGPVADYLSALTGGGRTDYLTMVRQFISTFSRPGLVVLLSDFLDDGDCLKPLQYLADFSHELMLVQIWSEQDRTPDWDGDLTLADAETGERLEISLNEEARRAYTESFDRYAEGIEQLALRNGGRYVGLSTATPLEEAIFGALDRSSAPVERIGSVG